MIKTQNLTFSYPVSDEDNSKNLNIFENLDLEIEQGTFTAILGHNGCGKSTLAKHFNAILLPCGGNVFVDGIDTQDEDLLFEIRKKAGMVFQNPDNQIVAALVEDEVAFAPENLGIEQSEIRKIVDYSLSSVGMSKYINSSTASLSGGQKQRVAIASILAMKPRYIILDEPTAMLDPKGRKEVISTIKKLNKENGITVILITHYMDEAVQADRVIVMQEGSVILDDTPKKVFSNTDELKACGLDVPQVTELTHILIKNGYAISGDIIDIDECANTLIKFLPH